MPTSGKKHFFVYLLASERNGTLYVGMTSNLPQRIWQHKQKVADGFTERYGIAMLVWYAACDTAEAAITREKQIKKWNRAWKRRLIEEQNPTWRDLYDDIGPGLLESRLRRNDELISVATVALYLVTGGAGFIGSHLADALLARGAQVRVLDNLSPGKRE